MLEQLFGSRTRVKLLTLFLRHPQEPMFVRELTRRIDTQINAVRRELANLVRLGLVVEAVAAAESEADPKPEDKKQAGVKRRYYMTNPNFPLLAEMTTLIIKSQLLLERRLDQEIAKLGDIRYMAFLGLFIGKSGAPVDLFVIGNLDAQGMQNLVTGLEHDMGCEVKFTCMTPEEYRYRKDMTDKFLYAILEAPKNVVLDRLSERPRVEVQKAED